MKSRRTKTWIGNLAWVLIIGAQIYWLLYDLPFNHGPSVGKNDRGEARARLLTHLRDVHFQEMGQLVWHPVKSEQNFFGGQSVMTLKSSQAELEFNDGSRFLLDENSLIEITEKSEAGLDQQLLVLKLRRGSFHVAHQTQPLSLQLGESLVQLKENSQVTVAKSEGDKEGFSIIVNEGEISLTEISGQSTAASGGEILDIETQGTEISVMKRRLKLVTLLPVTGSSFVARNSVRIPFQLQAKDLADDQDLNLRLDFSSRRDFSSLLATLPLQKREGGFQTEIAASRLYPGQRSAVYWRVLQSGDIKPISQGKIWVEDPPRSSALYPFDQSRLASDKEIGFVWQPIDGAETYVLKVTPQAVNEESFLVETEDLSHVLASLKPGAYFWQVQAKFDGHEEVSEWSEPKRLDIFDASPPPPDALLDSGFQFQSVRQPAKSEGKRITPKARKQKKESNRRRRSQSWFWQMVDPLPSWAQGEPSSIAGVQNSWQVRLKWEEVKGVSKYRLQISNQRSFSKILVDEVIPGTEYYWHYSLGMENKEGKVFYRVGSIAEDGRSGTFSEAQAIPIPQEILSLKKKVEPRAPEAGLDLGAPDIELDEKVNGYVRYRRFRDLQVSLAFGLGSTKQLSDASDLQAVSLEKAFLQQRLELAGIYETHQRQIQVLASFQGASYSASESLIPAPLQNDLTAYRWNLDALYRRKNTQPWQLSYGLTLDGSYRFEKSGSQSVDTNSALSLGPALQVIRPYQMGSRPLEPAELGLFVRAPFSGLFMSGRFGVEARIWAEWKLKEVLSNRADAQGIPADPSGRPLHHWIGLKAEFQVAWAKWKEPSGTQLTSWVFFLAPSFHYSH